MRKKAWYLPARFGTKPVHHALMSTVHPMLHDGATSADLLEDAGAYHSVVQWILQRFTECFSMHKSTGRGRLTSSIGSNGQHIMRG